MANTKENREEKHNRDEGEKEEMKDLTTLTQPKNNLEERTK